MAAVTSAGPRVGSGSTVSPRPKRADAWATVVMVLGEADAAPLLESRGLSAMIIAAGTA